LSLNNPSEIQLTNLFEYYEAGRYSDAEKLAISITQEFPNHPFAWKILGALFKKIGKNSEALNANQKAAMLSPKDPGVHNNLGVILKEFGRIDEAELCLRQAIALKPDFAEAHNNLGTTLQELGRLDEAEKCLRQATALKPDFAEAYNNLGTTLKELSKLKEAEASYRQAIILKSDYVQAYFNLGVTLYSLDRFEETSFCYNQVIALKPNFVEAHFNLGITLKEMGRLEEAEVSYRQAITHKAGYAEAYNNLGNILKELGRLNEAEASLRTSISHKTNFPQAHNNLGNILQELGRLDEAEASYRKGITLKAEYAEAHHNLGITLKELGRLEEAEASFKKAITLKEGYSQAHQNLGIMLQYLGRLDEAADHLKLSTTVISDAYLLRCFYKLDQQSNFDNQLNYILNQGHNNALIGSLISQSNIRYGFDQHNPFCNEPLKYVYETSLLERYDFETIFIKPASQILNDHQVQYKNQGLLSNGIQTAGNIFTQSIEATDNIQNIIHHELKNYLINFKNSTEGFITTWPTNYDLNGWLVSMNSGGELTAHMHERGWVSGSIYINVPPKSKKYSGNLVVGLEDEENSEKGNIKSIDVVTGSLCLFPSSLHHYTIPFESSEDRIVLAFDIVPRIKT